MSYVFRLKLSVWWAKREATQSAEPRVHRPYRFGIRHTRSAITYPVAGHRSVRNGTEKHEGR